MSFSNDSPFLVFYLQRGSEELAMSNGAVLSPQSNHADNNNDAKKVTTKERNFSFFLFLLLFQVSVCKHKRGGYIVLTSFFPDVDGPEWLISTLKAFGGVEETGQEMTNFIVNVILICFSKNNEQVKLEPRSPAKPSRVVHIRNIPNDVTEAEIVHLGIPFGRVTNVLVLKGKNQVRSLSSGHLVSRSSGPRRRPYFFLDRSQGFVRPQRRALMMMMISKPLPLITAHVWQFYLET